MAAKNALAIDGGLTASNKSFETGVQDWAMTCGVCHVGGGQMEYDRNMNAYDPSATNSENQYFSFVRNQIVPGFMSDTNKMEIDCLMCHLNNSATGANENGAGRAWYQSYNCGPSNPIGPMNDPYCQVVGPDPNFGLPGAGPFTPGTAYDPENRNIALKTLSLQYGPSLGIGAKPIFGTTPIVPGDPTYTTITGITGVPSTILGANIQTTPTSQNCSACHARDDNTPGYPGMLSTVRLGYGNMISIMPPGTAVDVDQCTAAEVAAGTCPNVNKKNTVRWIEFGCKTGMGKRGQKIGAGPNDKWGMSMFSAMFGLGKNPGAPIASETIAVTNPNMLGAGITSVTTKERIPDFDVHDVGWANGAKDAKPRFQCATCHYAIGSSALTGVATLGGFLANNTTGTCSVTTATSCATDANCPTGEICLESVTIPAEANAHGLNRASGEDGVFGVNYPAETILGIDHQFAQGDNLKDTYGKNNLDATVSCEGCHTTRTHPRIASGEIDPPIPTHAGFPAIHLDKISCNTCHIPEIYVAPFRLKSRDWTLGFIKKGNETNGAFKNIYDWNYDLVTGSHTPITPLHQWATKYEKKQIYPVTPAEMPIWIALDNLNNGLTDKGNSGSLDGVTPDDTSAIKTCTYGARIFATCNSDADCPGGKCVSGLTSYAAPAKTRDVMAAAETVQALGNVLRRPSGNINTGSLVPLFDGWPFPDGQGVDTKARIDAMVSHGAGSLLKIFHAPFDITHGVVPKEWALGGSKRGGCVSCHSSKQPYSYDANGSITGPNPNYSPNSIGFFEGAQHWMPEQMGVGKYDMLKNPFSFFADFDCTAIVNGLCSSDQMCMGMCMGMMGNSAANCTQFCGARATSCSGGTGPGGSFTDNDLFNPMSGDPSSNFFLGQCIGFMQPNFDKAMNWPAGTAQAMGLMDGVNGLQGFMTRETIAGTALGCNPIIGPKNIAIMNMGGWNYQSDPNAIANATNTVNMMGNLNSCMPSYYGGTCSNMGNPPQGYPASCVGGFRNGKGCIPMDLGFGADADCAGTLPSDEATHNPNGLLLSRGEVRARFDLHLQQSSVVVPAGTYGLSDDNINTVWWPILTEQNPDNPNHLWAWDAAGSPNVCGAFQNEPCCTNPMTNMPVSCSDGMNVRTTIHANQLLGFLPIELARLMTPATAGVSMPTASFTYKLGNPNTLIVNLDGSSSICPSGTCSYAWNFGDGNTGSGATTSHTFAAAGSYNVTLTVADAVSTLSATNAVKITTIAPDALPAAAFAPGSPSLSGWTVSVTDASTDPDGYVSTNPNAMSSATAISIVWGDGATTKCAQNATVTHTYATAGSYAIKLTATDNSGLSNTVTASPISISLGTVTGTVTIGGLPASSAKVQLTRVGGPNPYVYTNASGVYSITNVKPGAVTITATKGATTLGPTAVNVTSGTNTVNFP